MSEAELEGLPGKKVQCVIATDARGPVTDAQSRKHLERCSIVGNYSREVFGEGVLGSQSL